MAPHGLSPGYHSRESEALATAPLHHCTTAPLRLATISTFLHYKLLGNKVWLLCRKIRVSGYVLLDTCDCLQLCVVRYGSLAAVLLDTGLWLCVVRYEFLTVCC